MIVYATRVETSMSGAPNGGIENIYPGTFDARSTYSFKKIFSEIRRRVTIHVFRGYSLPSEIHAHDVIDLLSRHTVPVKFRNPSGGFDVRPVQLEGIQRIDEETRLLLSDMAAGIETPFVIDRLSRMALQWPWFTFRFNRTMAIIINPPGDHGVSLWLRDPAYFLSLVSLHAANDEDSAQMSYGGDVIIELCTATQYELVRASYEPVIPDTFSYVVRVRFGLRTCVMGVDGEVARVLGYASKRVFDLSNRMFGRFLVPGLYTR